MTPISEEAKRQAKDAYDLLGRLRPKYATAPTNEELMLYGMKLHPYTYADGATDHQAMEKLGLSVDQDAFYGSEMTKLLLQVPNEQLMIMWATRWIDQGCPRVVFDSRYASLLMATDVGADILDRIVFPWRAFLLEMPDGLLTIKDGVGALHDVCKVFVQVMQLENRDDYTLNTIAMAKNGLQLWRHGVAVDKLTTSKIAREGTWGIGFKTDSRDDRVLNLIGRLVISMCVALSDPDNFHKQKASRKIHHISAKYRDPSEVRLPEIQTFVIGRPTKINCRPAIIDYIEEGSTRKGPTVRFLVRGHWKLQPHGVNNLLRKLIRIDPYWKGPEEAKILTRTIKMEHE